MNINQRFKCSACETHIDARLGMSNRDIQPIRFACLKCGEGIEITVSHYESIRVTGAELVPFEGPFDGSNPFVDIHIDFPVSFDKYVMGETPFMKAVTRIGHGNFAIHNFRLDSLNYLYKKVDALKRILRLYSKNPDLFGRLCKKEFDEELRSTDQKDINLALYCVLAKVFYPFAMPNDNAEAVELYMDLMAGLHNDKKDAFELFLKEIVDTDFLKNLQKDCLEIYPEILSSELALRPALFLDFDDDYEKELVGFRVSVDDFQKYKDLYKDISEILSRQLVIVGGLNNLLHRGDHNSFNDIGKHTPKNMNKFADVAFGQKSEHLDDCWYEIGDGVIDNQLRNSIAHYKAEYDEISQIITYYPRKEGIKQEKSETLYFLDFMRKILISYREMHRLHQLIKCLFNYYFIIYEPNA
ncbi:MAG: hypothetical protein ABGX82_12365 [Pseudomonas sp.]|uniref:hypothetical protein n=1 Tax=Pseudomonas sp. TaxID=306 RepID=UPI003241EFD2